MVSAHNIRNLDIATSGDGFAMTEGDAPRSEGNVLCLVISPRSDSIISPGGCTTWRLALAPVCGGEPLAALWFARTFCVTFLCVHFRLLSWHRLPLAGSGPFSQTLFPSLLFDLPLVASIGLGREAACRANAAIGWKPLDSLDSFMRLRASTLFVCTTS